ncbi:MAG: hypothetical protein CMJ75_01620 [Planctomycetaceae bacterium]|nr:hypothetical protein [Planctomycetaceae bacterium]
MRGAQACPFCESADSNQGGFANLPARDREKFVQSQDCILSLRILSVPENDTMDGLAVFLQSSLSAIILRAMLGIAQRPAE